MGVERNSSIALCFSGIIFQDPINALEGGEHPHSPSQGIHSSTMEVQDHIN